MVGVGLLPEDLLHRLRRLGGLPGHPDVDTPHMPFNTGSLGMGISKAKGVVYANRQAGREENVFVMTGDGELQEGQIWESLGPAANRRLGEIIAIVDHNKLQSDIWVSKVSDLGDLEAKFTSFGWHVQRCDGHNFGALESCIAAAKAETDRPSVIIADTVKGKGVSFMESTAHPDDDTLYRYHSGAPSDAEYEKAHEELLARVSGLLESLDAEPLAMEAPPEPDLPLAPPESPQSLPKAYAEALLEQGRAKEKLVVLDADLMLDCGLIPFREAFPDRFVECGIAEQDMVSQAGAMARKGLTPIAHSFACFMTPRANEQIYNNATEGTKVIYAGFLAGLLPAGPGHSHQSVRDIGILSGVPGLTLIEPSCEVEVAMALDYAVNVNENSSYIRLVSIPCDIPYALPENYRFVPGRGCVLREGREAVLFAYGPVMLPLALQAADLLQPEGIALQVVNLPWLNKVDEVWLSETVDGATSLFTLDNHYRAGGQGQMLAAALAENGLMQGRTLVRFGLDEVPECGRNDEVLAHHGLDAKTLAVSIEQAIKGN
jgi:transketolase